MNPKRYKRDSYSKALVISNLEQVSEFAEKKKMERTIDVLKDEIHNMKSQMQEILNTIRTSQENNSQCQ